MNVFDSSALLCLLLGEPGAADVESALESDDARCSAVNWSEISQKVLTRQGDWSSARAVLLDYGLVIESVRADDAEAAAALWTPGNGLSLADRICLATAERLDATAWTVDTAWGTGGRIRQVR